MRLKTLLTHVTVVRMDVRSVVPVLKLECNLESLTRVPHKIFKPIGLYVNLAQVINVTNPKP